MEILQWIQNWYASHCDGEWEHMYGVKIDNLDNPGWVVKIDIAETELQGLNIEYKLIEKSAEDWYGYSIKNNVFDAAGDPTKLELLLNKFREIAEQCHKTNLN